MKLSNELKVNIPATLAFGSDIDNIIITSLSMTNCLAKLNLQTKPRQPVIVKLLKTDSHEEKETFTPIKATIESAVKKNSNPLIFEAKIKFNDTIRVSQGVVQ